MMSIERYLIKLGKLYKVPIENITVIKESTYSYIHWNNGYCGYDFKSRTKQRLRNKLLEYFRSGKALFRFNMDKM
jgi:hypothetical protein